MSNHLTGYALPSPLNSRLLCLYGMSGMGKTVAATRLARNVAATSDKCSIIYYHMIGDFLDLDAIDDLQRVNLGAQQAASLPPAMGNPAHFLVHGDMTQGHNATTMENALTILDSLNGTQPVPPMPRPIVIDGADLFYYSVDVEGGNIRFSDSLAELISDDRNTVMLVGQTKPQIEELPLLDVCTPLYLDFNPQSENTAVIDRGSCVVTQPDGESYRMPAEAFREPAKKTPLLKRLFCRSN